MLARWLRRLHDKLHQEIDVERDRELSAGNRYLGELQRQAMGQEHIRFQGQTFTHTLPPDVTVTYLP